MLKDPVSYAGLEIRGMNLFKLSYFNAQLKKTIPLVYWKNPNVLKFHDLMNTEDVSKVAPFS